MPNWEISCKEFEHSTNSKVPTISLEALASIHPPPDHYHEYLARINTTDFELTFVRIDTGHNERECTDQRAMFHLMYAHEGEVGRSLESVHASLGRRDISRPSTSVVLFDTLLCKCRGRC